MEETFLVGLGIAAVSGLFWLAYHEPVKLAGLILPVLWLFFIAWTSALVWNLATKTTIYAMMPHIGDADAQAGDFIDDLAIIDNTVLAWGGAFVAIVAGLLYVAWQSRK